MTDLKEILAARVTTETFTYAEVQAIIADKNNIQNELTEAKKKLAEVERHKDMYYKASNEKETQLDQIHDILTALGIPERKEGEDYRYTKYPLMTRIALFISKKD